MRIVPSLSTTASALGNSNSTPALVGTPSSALVSRPSDDPGRRTDGVEFARRDAFDVRDTADTVRTRVARKQVVVRL